MNETQEIFAAALEIADQRERAAMLDRACASHPDRRAHVDELLAVQNDADRFFSACDRKKTRLPLSWKSRCASDHSEDAVGLKIGPYKVLQKIGQGGCGIVYMAEQEKPVRRRVALKIIKLGMDTSSVIARFESERQALAMMDHPNIARVLDAGQTDTGRPYFVMELIHGVGLLEYCDKNHLAPRQRLELFVQICHAIQHAHQKGIVHRDIKPSNILVTMHDGTPVPKVIDFGIAKAMTEPLTEKTLFTVYGTFIGTPTYMSPEQAEYSGLDVDTRSDVYSLGVLLYELLTGKTPFDQAELIASGLDEMRRTLREREPHRPSAKLATLTPAELTATATRCQVDTPKLKLLLKGDLDWIVMKALEKDRQRRYETVNGLAMDVLRHLNNEPVAARPPSRWYRFEKLVRRNKVVFAAGAAVALALVAGLGTSTWLFAKERQMRRRAVAAEQQAVQARREENRFRREAEARADIAQAAILLSRGKFAEAAKLAEPLSVPVDQPSLEAAGVFGALGDRAAAEGRWVQAAADFQRAHIAAEIEKTEYTERTSSDVLRLGPTLVAAGDIPGYRQFVKQTIVSFSAARDLGAAEQITKTCLLCPPDAADLAGLEPFVEALAQNFEKSRANLGDKMVAWREFALSLCAYRRGQYQEAAVYQQACLTSTYVEPERTAMSHFLFALISYAQGEFDLASAELKQGDDLIRQYCPEAAPNKISISGMAPEVSTYWYDWVTAQLLQREAHQRITLARLQ